MLFFDLNKSLGLQHEFNIPNQIKLELNNKVKLDDEMLETVLHCYFLRPFLSLFLALESL